MQKRLFLEKSGFIRVKVFKSGSKVVAYSGINDSNQAKMNVVAVFGFYSGKIRAKVVVEQSCCIREKVVVFGQKWLIRAKWLYSGKSGWLFRKSC